MHGKVSLDWDLKNCDFLQFTSATIVPQQRGLNMMFLCVGFLGLESCCLVVWFMFFSNE